MTKLLPIISKEKTKAWKGFGIWQLRGSQLTKYFCPVIVIFVGGIAVRDIMEITRQP